ncbi:MFS transporter [Siminovitchia terrae]|uniref:MFS transporter n=1 Tax=Siminovitchia terrae TaxID=1914933 RepID=A0ABQ4L3H0_SIMTE|nr:MFS transporter [Siminovitchia terrae]GIN98424.1 MFS transporter [Siminovitchia terrae]
MKTTQILAFTATILGFFMALLDTTIVNIALPDMISTFNTNISDVSWVTNGYNLSFAIFLLTASRIADKYGRKKVFLFGIILFVVSSVLCGLSTDLNYLILFRVIQGLGAAIIVPVSIPIALEIFSKDQRGKIIGIWGAFSALASASGPVLGGVLVNYLGWEYIFYVNVPLGILATILVIIYLKESYGDNKNIKLDITGTILFTLFISSLTYALIKGNDYGWLSASIIVLLSISLISIIIFLIREKRVNNPMIPLKIFKDRYFSMGNVTLFLIGVILNSILFIFAFYLTKLVGYTVLKSGLILSTLALATMVFSALSGPIVQKRGSLVISFIGLFILSVTSFIMTYLEFDSAIKYIILLLIACGVGVGLCLAPVMSSIVERGGQDYLGLVSGISNVGRTLGSIVGIAITVCILNISMDTQIEQSKKEVTTHIENNSALNEDVKNNMIEGLNNFNLDNQISKNNDEFIQSINKVQANFNKTDIEYQALEIQKEEGLKEIAHANNTFKSNFMKSFSYVFLAICMISVIALITSLFSDKLRKEKGADTLKGTTAEG